MESLSQRYSDLNKEVNERYKKVTEGRKISLVGQELKDMDITFNKNMSIADQIELFQNEQGDIWSLPQVQFYNRRERYDSLYITHIDNGIIHGYDDDYDTIQIDWTDTTDTDYNIELVEYLESISVGKKVKDFLNKLD